MVIYLYIEHFDSRSPHTFYEQYESSRYTCHNQNRSIWTLHLPLSCLCLSMMRLHNYERLQNKLIHLKETIRKKKITSSHFQKKKVIYYHIIGKTIKYSKSTVSYSASNFSSIDNKVHITYHNQIHDKAWRKKRNA